MDMLNEVLRILTIYHGDSVLANPNIPRELEHYARAALDIPDDEYVMATLRTSYKKFHRGLVIGRDGIYWLNGPTIKTDVNRLTWRELSERKKQIRSLYKQISLGGDAMFDNTGSIEGNKYVINILDLLIDRYQQQQIDSDGFVFEKDNLDVLMRSVPDNKAELKADNEKSAAEANVSMGTWIANFFKKKLGK